MTKKSKTAPERMELARWLVKEFDLKTVAVAQDLLKEIVGPMLQSIYANIIFIIRDCGQNPRL